MALSSANALDEIAAGLADKRQWRAAKTTGTLQNQEEYSYWVATGGSPAGAIPTTAAYCNNSTTGNIFPGRTQATSPAKDYIAAASVQVTTAANNPMTYADRLAHMGGLSGTVTTSQTVGLDLTSTSDNMTERKGAASGADVAWYLEFYTATGSTAANFTVGVTYTDASTDSVVITVAASTGRIHRIIEVISATSGKIIASIDSVLLSVSTGTAGNFGFTAYRRLATLSGGTANSAVVKYDWANLPIVEIPASACVVLLTRGTGTASINVTLYTSIITV